MTAIRGRKRFGRDVEFRKDDALRHRGERETKVVAGGDESAILFSGGAAVGNLRI